MTKKSKLIPIPRDKLLEALPGIDGMSIEEIVTYLGHIKTVIEDQEDMMAATEQRMKKFLSTFKTQRMAIYLLILAIVCLLTGYFV
jgi:hypothetical protein